MKLCDMFGMKVGDLVLSDIPDGRVGVIVVLPEDCKRPELHFAKVKFGNLQIRYYTIEHLIRARQRFLDATTNR